MPFRSLPDEYAINRRTSVIAALVAVVGTVLVAAMVLPALAPILEQLSDGVVLGVALLVSTAVRVAAGVLGARAKRRQDGLDSRTAAIPSVLIGITVGWLSYLLLVMLAGAEISVVRLLVELVRWLAEAALGAYLVQVGAAGAQDPRLRSVEARSIGRIR